MGHQLDHADVLDLLEEAVTSRRPVAVDLRRDRRFADRVLAVVTDRDGDWAVFAAHDPELVRDIHFVSRAEPWEPTYAGKRHVR